MKLSAAFSHIMACFGAAFVLCVGLPGCGGSRSGDFAYAPKTFTAPDPTGADAITREYRLGPTDVVSIVVYRAEDLSGDLRVDEAGNITMPLIGQVSAQGKTTVQLAQSISAQLSKKYYENPNVHVALKEAAGQRITVDGAVTSPGVYPIAGRTTLMQAIAMAKGTDQYANLSKVVIFRTIQGQRQAAAFDLKSIRNNQMQDPEVYSSDIIIVDGNAARQSLREIMSAVPILGIFAPAVY